MSTEIFCVCGQKSQIQARFQEYDLATMLEMPSRPVGKARDIDGWTGSSIELDTGETIIEEGQPVTDLYVVIRGELEVFLPKAESRLTRIDVARKVSGDCIGEYSFVDKDPASASASRPIAPLVSRWLLLVCERGRPRNARK